MEDQDPPASQVEEQDPPASPAEEESDAGDAETCGTCGRAYEHEDEDQQCGPGCAEYDAGDEETRLEREAEEQEEDEIWEEECAHDGCDWGIHCRSEDCFDDHPLREGGYDVDGVAGGSQAGSWWCPEHYRSEINFGEMMLPSGDNSTTRGKMDDPEHTDPFFPAGHGFSGTFYQMS